MPVLLKKIKKLSSTAILLPSSKSESNRALIINALSGSKLKVRNLSEARDTQIMSELLSSGEKVLDVADAGTTMRFLTAYFSVLNKNKVLTGSRRMKERPIGILVDALRKLGGKINYMEKEGFPPVETVEFTGQATDRISIRGDVSSQYISAILMIAPVLRDGLTVELTGNIGSRPYIAMTLGIMAHFGIKNTWEENMITIRHQSYLSRPFTVSPDWSAASYWYSFASLLSDEAEIRLNGLNAESFQGDKVIAEIMNSLGVSSHSDSDGIRLVKKDHVPELSWDFSDCPDLVQTVAVTAAAKGVILHMKGIESLRIKETDRIAALKKELSKMGAELMNMGPGEWTLTPINRKKLPELLNINTYGDHRMAMAFAPLAALTDVRIEDQDVVKKSYPGFWNDLEKSGIPVMKY